MPELTSTQTFDHPDNNPGAPGKSTGPKWSRGPHDDLMLPNGSVVGQTDNETLRRLFAGLGIEGAWTRPRNELVADYVRVLKKVFDTAGNAAVTAFLESKKEA
jgi:hypothetical protein